MDQHPAHLITAIGVPRGSYSPVAYSLGNQSHATKYAPVALAHLLPLSGARASVLATDAASNGVDLQHLLDELRQAGVSAQWVRANDGSSPGDFLETLQQLIGLVQESERVILDVTFSLRHLPFAYLAALTYLTSFKSVSIDGIYYGAYEQRHLNADGIEVAPIHDLSVLFEAMRWYHAVETASESGNLRPLLGAVHQAKRDAGSRTKRSVPIGRLLKPLSRLADSLAAGLPLETGLSARKLLNALRDVDADASEPTLARLSMQPFESLLEEVAVPDGVTSREKIPLDEGELRRQLRLIRWYAERGNVQEVLLLLREWLVSLAYMQVGGTSSWLGYQRRHDAEIALNAAAARFGQLKIGNREIGSLWTKVSRERNKLAHSGTDSEPRDARGQQKPLEPPSRDETLTWIQKCEALLTAPLELAPPGKDRILLSPLGFTPGVLFTAASSQKPDQVIVLASAQTEPLARQALEAAGMGTLPLETRILADPYGGVTEADGMAKALQGKLLEAAELIVNLTGGTTMMQLVAEKVAASARGLGIPVTRILLIDRRPPQEQRDNPYVLGEVIELPDGAVGDTR